MTHAQKSSMDCLLMVAKNASVIQKALSIYNAIAVVGHAPVNQALEETSVISVCQVSTTLASQAVLVSSYSLTIYCTSYITYSCCLGLTSM